MGIWKPLNNSAPGSFLALGQVPNNKFNLALSDYDVAGQIAQLLNNNNRLTVTHDVNTIIVNQTRYFVEVYGQVVAGCVGLTVEEKMDKIVNISVLTTYRRLGIAKKLLLFAIDKSNKDIIYMHVREDNIASLNLANSVGFKVIAYFPRADYKLLTLCLFRRNKCL